MKQRTRIVVAATTAVVAVAAVGIGVTASATSDDDATDTPITGDALTQASEVALAHIGSGRVTATEVGDEESYYEVEVTLDDGSQVDVQLDEKFAVVASAPDVEEEKSDGG
jgi:uncharacterized membrane protein YkoI